MKRWHGWNAEPDQHGGYVDFDDAKRMQARLLVRAVRLRAEVLEHRANLLTAAPDLMWRHRRWADWYDATADRIAAKYLKEKP